MNRRVLGAAIGVAAVVGCATLDRMGEGQGGSAGAPTGSGGGGGVGGEGLTGGDGGVGGQLAPWWNANWQSRAAITFNNSAQAEDLVEFPVLVRLDATTIDYGATQDAGQDIRFVEPTSNEVLAHEIEDWNETGSSFLWVKVPRINASSDSDFVWMYYDNPSAADEQDAPAVWSASYRAVWHLNETVDDEQITGTHHDSTGNGNEGDQSGNDDVVVAGSIARAQDFDGDDHIAVPELGLQDIQLQVTIQARVYPRTFGTDRHVVGAGSDGHWQLWWDSDNAGWCGRFRLFSGSPATATSNEGSLAAWATLALVFDSSAVQLYLDGQPIGTPDTGGLLEDLDAPLFISDNPVLLPGGFDGYIDEVRISTAVRSPTWIAAQHLSLADLFVVVHPPETR